MKKTLGMMIAELRKEKGMTTCDGGRSCGVVDYG